MHMFRDCMHMFRLHASLGGHVELVEFSNLLSCCCPAATGHNVTIIAADATPTAPLSVTCLDINLVSNCCLSSSCVLSSA